MYAFNLKACYKSADNTFGYALRRLLFMARDKVSTSKPQTDEDLVDDDFDIDDSDSPPDVVENISQPDRLVTRRRLEDYFEEKRLKEQMGDDYF